MRLSFFLLILLFIPLVRAGAGPVPDRSMPVPRTYFGMHIHHFGAIGDPYPVSSYLWPTVQFSGWRLWDAGVTWPELEPQLGVWNFERLDSAVALAERRHVEILLTLGLTPGWASTRPSEPSDYKPGNAAPPKDLANWRDYVRTVAQRYRGRIHLFEIWNEPNYQGDFTGDVATVEEMTEEAARILKEVDRGNLVVSASPSSKGGLSWFDRYLSAGAGSYVDVIGYHFYVTPGAPEEMTDLIQSVRRIMARHGIGDKPLWNTESGWAKPKTFSSQQEAAAYIARAYILNWSSGVDRFYWYAWDNHWWTTLELTDAKSEKPNLAAHAYAVTQDWLEGAVVRSCGVVHEQLWRCELRRDQAAEWILWNADGDSVYHLPPELEPVRTMKTLDGRSEPILHGEIQISISPILLVQ